MMRIFKNVALAIAYFYVLIVLKAFRKLSFPCLLLQIFRSGICGLQCTVFSLTTEVVHHTCQRVDKFFSGKQIGRKVIRKTSVIS